MIKKGMSWLLLFRKKYINFFLYSLTLDSGFFFFFFFFLNNSFCQQQNGVLGIWLLGVFLNSFSELSLEKGI